MSNYNELVELPEKLPTDYTNALAIALA